MDNSKTILNQDANQLSKNNIERAIDTLKMEIEEGNINPLDLYLKAKYLHTITEGILKQIKEPTKTEIAKYQKGENKMFGASFSVRNGYEVLDYKADEEYARLEQELNDRKQALKEARKLQKKGALYVTAEGEQIDAPPIARFTEDSIVIGFKKE